MMGIRMTPDVLGNYGSSMCRTRRCIGLEWGIKSPDTYPSQLRMRYVHMTPLLVVLLPILAITLFYPTVEVWDS